MHTFSIVIPTYQRPTLLDRLLQSIYECEIPDSLVDICVVENGDSDCAQEICNNWTGKLPVRYFYESKPEVSNARNVGTRAANGDVIIFFDDDIRCHEKTLKAYHLAIQKHGLNFFYGGPLKIEYETLPPEWLVRFLPNSAKGFSLDAGEQVVSNPVFMGGNHAITKTQLIRFKGFDSLCASGNEGAGGEENRIQKKLIEHGIPGIYIPDACVWHYVPQERCTPKWALHRQYRYGLGQGLIESSNNEEYRLFLKIPVWLWRMYLGLVIRFIFAKLAGSSIDEELFSQKMKIHEIRGIMEGYKKTNLEYYQKKMSTSKEYRD